MNNTPARHALLLLLSSSWLPACLGPAVSDEAAYSTSLLDRDAKVARVDDNMPLSLRIDMADGFEGPIVALRTGFLAGAEVRYWDFGSALATAEPVWQFRRKGAQGALEAVGHLDLIDSAPGDSNYSPFRQIYTVLVSDAYAGERITTLQALDDAIELGLVGEPKRTQSYVNWPMALASSLLEQGEGEPMSPQAIYYRGRVASYFDPTGSYAGMGGLELEREPIPAPNAYVLRRQNETRALDEAALRADLDGDGDMLDSNVVFQLGVDEPGYTSIWRQVDVTVAADYAWASSKGEGDLFERDEKGGLHARSQVVAYQESMLLLNRVLQRSAP